MFRIGSLLDTKSRETSEGARRLLLPLGQMRWASAQILLGLGIWELSTISELFQEAQSLDYVGYSSVGSNENLVIKYYLRRSGGRKVAANLNMSLECMVTKSGSERLRKHMPTIEVVCDKDPTVGTACHWNAVLLPLESI